MMMMITAQYLIRYLLLHFSYIEMLPDQWEITLCRIIGQHAYFHDLLIPSGANIKGNIQPLPLFTGHPTGCATKPSVKVKMALLADLPHDLLWIIMKTFEGNEILRLSYVCKGLRKLAEPHLYREITWINKQGPSASRKVPLHLLLRTILGRSELAHHVKILRIIGVISPSVGTRADDQLTADAIGPASDLVRTVGLPREEKWIEGIRQGNVDVYLALLLSQLSGLQALMLDRGFQYNSPFMGMMLQRMLFSADAANRLSKGDQLQSVGFTKPFGRYFAFDENTIDPDQNLVLFYLASIGSISVSMPEPGPQGLTWPGGRARPCASTLTQLHLKRSQLQPDNLGEILRATPNLKEFSYELYCDADPEPERASAYVKCDQLGRALELVRSSLEKLSIAVGFYASSAMDVDEAGGSWERGAAWGIKSSLGDTLRGFTKLQELSIPVVVLLGWSATSSKTTSLADVLPPHPLRKLCITADLGGWLMYEWTDRICQTLIVDYLLDRHGEEPILRGILPRLKAVLPPPIYKNWDEEWDGGGGGNDDEEEDAPLPAEVRQMLIEACELASIDATEFGVEDLGESHRES